MTSGEALVSVDLSEAGWVVVEKRRDQEKTDVVQRQGEE